MYIFLKKFSGKLIGATATLLARIITSRPVPRSVPEWRFADFTYAQFAEDVLVLRAIQHLGKTEIGYYVDVGAFHPWMYSNTVRLHWLGWRGINIDARTEHIADLKRERHDDINLHCAVSASSGSVDFLCYDSGETGRIATQDKDDGKSILGEEPRCVVNVPTETLAALLAIHAPKDKSFGFLSIDCEGFDLQVLKSNDWEKFKPWVVAVEDHAKTLDTEIDGFLKAQGYSLWAMAHVTKIFILDQDLM